MNFKRSLGKVCPLRSVSYIHILFRQEIEMTQQYLLTWNHIIFELYFCWWHFQIMFCMLAKSCSKRALQMWMCGLLMQMRPKEKWYPSWVQDQGNLLFIMKYTSYAVLKIIPVCCSCIHTKIELSNLVILFW